MYVSINLLLNIFIVSRIDIFFLQNYYLNKKLIKDLIYFKLFVYKHKMCV